MPKQPRSDASWPDELEQLIRHGRDREAAALAAEKMSIPAEGRSMDPRAQLDAIVPSLTDLVATIDDSQLDAPTPCAAFSVRDVLAHMIGGATLFAAAFTDETPGEPPAGDLRQGLPIALEGLRASVHSDGALDRTIAAPFGEVPGAAFARFVALDGLVHGWDIATATGQPYEPPADLVEAVDTFAREAITDDMRDGDTFAPPTAAPDGASPLEQLVAFTGRTVGGA